MLLSTTLLLALVTKSLSASVTFFSNDPLLGDYVTCSSSEWESDTQLADLLALEMPDDATREGTTFYYNMDLACGSDYSYAVSLQCTGVGGQSECHQRLLGRSRITANLHARQPSSSDVSPLSKRNAYYCKDASQTCDDTVDANAFGGCPSGYEREKVRANGYIDGYICTKPCTEAQKAECLSNVCTHRRKQCAKYPGSKSFCGDALVKCRYTEDPAVSTDKEICNNKILKQSPGVRIPDCEDCVSVTDGKCHLDNAAYDNWLAKSEAAFKEFSQGVYFSHSSTFDLPV